MEKKIKSTTAKAGHKYFEGVGRRKTATARVRLTPGGTEAVVNGKTLKEYFVLDRYVANALASIRDAKLAEKFGVSVKVVGGGIAAQSEAVRHGAARALVKWDGELKKNLRVLGYLTRDSRMVERKKYGLRKARRAPQWAKR